MQVKKMSVLLTLVAFLLTGCASIVGQSVFPLSINSNPQGTTVFVKDEYGKDVFNGTTPTTVTLAAGESYFHAKSYTLTFSKPGYADQTAVVKSEISGWYFGNIVFGGLIGMLIVDPITGKMWKLPPNVYANLTQKVAANESNPALRIVTIDQVPENMRKSLIQIN